MKEASYVSVVTERGQVSIPAALRRALDLLPGRKLLWEPLPDGELRVRAIGDRPPAGPAAVLGFARRLRPRPRSTKSWMAELREGEK